MGVLTILDTGKCANRNAPRESKTLFIQLYKLKAYTAISYESEFSSDGRAYI